MSDIKRVDSPGSDFRRPDAISVSRSSRGFSFKKGDQLTVLVERVLGREKVLIDIGGRKVIAATTALLKSGDKIQVVVEKRIPFLLLRPVKGSFDPGGLLATSVRKAPPWDIDIGKLFSKLLAEPALAESSDLFLTLKKSVLEESVLAGGGRNGAKTLQEIIKNSGIFLENRLNSPSRETDIGNIDFKAALLQAVEIYQKANAPEKKVVLNDVKMLLSVVESFQGINSLNRERGEAMVFTVPFYFKGEVRGLKIFVNNRERGGKERRKEEFRVSLMLELGALKKIRADLFKKRSDVFVTLHVQEEWIRERVLAGFESLVEKLGKLGFNARAECFVSTGKYVEGEIPGREFISDADRTINFTI